MAIKKKFKVGTCKTYGGAYRSITIEVHYSDEGKLSICGSKGGSGGQIDMEFDHRDKSQNDSRESHLIKASEINFALGWNAEKWLDLLEIWSEYHLNGLNAGCEHQQELNWGNEELIIQQYGLNSDTCMERRNLEKRIVDSVVQGGSYTATDEERLIMSLPYRVSVPEGVKPICSERYNLEKTEKKRSNWVHPNEHPKGVLTKPCPVCGYKYGTSWYKREVPLWVIRFLNSIEDEPQKYYSWQTPEKTREYLYIKF